jgi:hypothetical protein
MVLLYRVGVARHGVTRRRNSTGCYRIRASPAAFPAAFQRAFSDLPIAGASLLHTARSGQRKHQELVIARLSGHTAQITAWDTAK